MKLQGRTRAAANAGFSARKAFTLIEIMVVVAVMAIIMTAGIPSIYKAIHKEGFRKTVSDIIDVCNSARARAIIKGEVTEVVFHPLERRCEVVGGGGGGGLAHSATIDETTRIEMLDINLHEFKDEEFARVRFYPNGTSDEMTLILVSDKNEWRKISLEISTGMASVDSDPQKWK